MSVSLLVGLLPYWKYTNIGISPALDEISFWNFWRHSYDVGTLFLDNSEFHVCLTVYFFAYFLTKIRQRYISRSGWDIYQNFFEDIPETLVHWFQIILIFLYVCQSGSWQSSLLKYDKFRDISSSRWNIFLNFYEHIPGMVVHLFQIILIFLYVSQSVI